MRIRLGTRQSALALWQANHVAAELMRLGHEVELVRITTSGDVSTTPLGQSDGQGQFTKEIQRALLDDRCDLAVHSLKDLPTEEHSSLKLAAVPEREGPEDCLVSRFGTLDTLPQGSKIGTGSPRRRAQLLHRRPDLNIADIRGNVDSRLRKLDEGQYDAIVLAFAGLHRLQLEHRITEKLDPDWMVPAVGQAALGLETRRDDEAAMNAISPLDHPCTHAAVAAERSLLRSMRAGCLAPLAAHARLINNSLHLSAKVFSADGQRVIEAAEQLVANADWPPFELYAHAELLGQRVAEQLQKQGAGELIRDARAESKEPS
jgi:hydroxymethylbilane synthase